MGPTKMPCLDLLCSLLTEGGAIISFTCEGPFVFIWFFSQLYRKVECIRTSILKNHLSIFFDGQCFNPNHSSFSDFCVSSWNKNKAISSPRPA